MLALSQTVGYAIEALATLADPDCANRQLADIAECSGVPRSYLAKIVAALGRKGLVSAKRGLGGGVSLARSAQDISLLDVVEAVEGPEWLGECLLNLRECSGPHTCPTHDFWAGFRRDVVTELQRHSLADLIQSHPGRARPRPGCCPPRNRQSRRADSAAPPRTRKVRVGSPK